MRPLTEDQRRTLERLSRAQSAPTAQLTRAIVLLAVADGLNEIDAAHSVGRRSNDAGSQLVCRFNQKGLAARDLRHGGGPASDYAAQERERILKEFRRAPDRQPDRTASWSLTSLQHALRTAPDGLPKVSRFTILALLHDAGYTWQPDRTWGKTRMVVRVRNDRPQQVTDPDAQAKNR